MKRRNVFAPCLPAAPLLLALLAALLAAGGVRAQRIDNVRPDAHVVVLLLPTGQYDISAVYPAKVPKAEAEAPLRVLLERTKWKASPLVYDNKEVESPTDGKQVLSSVSFTTESGLADTVTGTVEVEPFIHAFRAKNRVHLTFFLPATFAYRGVRKHADKNVEVAASVVQGTITYVVNIKNHQLESLNLPRTQAVPTAASGDDATTRASVSAGADAGLGVKIGLVVLGALAVGILVFTVAARAVRR